MNLSDQLALLLHFSYSLLDNGVDPVSQVPKNVEHGGSVVGFDAFRPEGRRFESHSSPL